MKILADYNFIVMRQIEDNSNFQPSKLHYRGNLSPIKPREKMPTVYRHRQSPSRQHLRRQGVEWPRDNSYLRSRLNQDIELQRSSMLIKTGRTSQDNPEWMSVNFQQYKKSHYQPLRKSTIIEQKSFDVFNNPKKSYSGRNEDNYFSSMVKNQRSTIENSDTSMRKTFLSFMMYQPEVTSKVGSLNTRDYSIPRPQLKVGSNSFIDTYTPA